MQRVTLVLAKPSETPAPGPLVPTTPVPHADPRSQSPSDWAWNETLAPKAEPSDIAAFAPVAYEPGYEYPLLVWLHGDATDEECLPEIMRHVSVRNYVAVAPRGVAPRDAGYGWTQDTDAIDAAEDAVFDAIDAARGRFSVHPQRVFLAGAGPGGTMAMRIALAHPERFAGAATIDGPLPEGRTPLGRVNDLRELPLLLAASKESPAFGEAAVGRDLRLLHSAGCRVAVRQYPGDDDLTDSMLADLNRWAMEIVCG